MTRPSDQSGGINRRRLLKGGAVVAVGVAGPAVLRVTPALAAYPERPIKIVVANTPGGPSDISARMMAAWMQEVLGGSVFVENKGGAGGNIGFGFAAHAEPDGYTILLTTSAFCVNPSLYHTIPYDPVKDFVSICEPVAGIHVFAVKADLPANDMHEFVALVKKEPGKVQCFGAADRHHAAAPVRGAQTARGHPGHGKRRVQRWRRRGQGSAGRYRAGELRLLGPRIGHDPGRHSQGPGADWTTRFAALPNVPTMLEQGYKDFVFDTYCAMMAPAKVPHEIVAKLEKVCLDILAKPENKEKLVTAGFEVTAKDGKGHDARIAREIPLFKKIIADAGIKQL